MNILNKSLFVKRMYEIDEVQKNMVEIMRKTSKNIQTDILNEFIAKRKKLENELIEIEGRPRKFINKEEALFDIKAWLNEIHRVVTVKQKCLKIFKICCIFTIFLI